jgi:hypothetical protein
MTSDEPIPESADSGGSLPTERSAKTSATRRLALMEGLRASLGHSHQALVGLDLAGIEQGTREQLILIRSLASELRQAQAAETQAAETQVPETRLASDGWELAQELRRSAVKVVEAARLQAALLRRAQHKLVVMANMLAGAERDYGPPPLRQGMSLARERESRAER